MVNDLGNQIFVQVIRSLWRASMDLVNLWEILLIMNNYHKSCVQFHFRLQNECLRVMM